MQVVLPTVKVSHRAFPNMPLDQIGQDSGWEPKAPSHITEATMQVIISLSAFASRGAVRRFEHAIESGRLMMTPAGTVLIRCMIQSHTFTVKKVLGYELTERIW